MWALTSRNREGWWARTAGATGWVSFHRFACFALAVRVYGQQGRQGLRGHAHEDPGGERSKKFRTCVVCSAPHLPLSRYVCSLLCPQTVRRLSPHLLSPLHLPLQSAKPSPLLSLVAPATRWYIRRDRSDLCFLSRGWNQDVQETQEATANEDPEAAGGVKYGAA